MKKIYVMTLLILLCKVMQAKDLSAPKIENSEYYKKSVILIKWNEVVGAKGYNVYKKNARGEYNKYNITEKAKFLDDEIESNYEYEYKVAAYDKDGNEGEISEEIQVYTKFYPKETMDIYPRKFTLGEKITIYFSAKKSKEIKKYRKRMSEKSEDIEKLPKQIFIRYGYNNWAEDYFEKGGTEAKMIYDEATQYWTYEMVVPTFVREIDFAFRDELDNWDTNNNKDYKIRAIEGNSGIYFVK